LLKENLAESILFGSVKGAYNDAQDREGLISDADGGTFFLDEIQTLQDEVTDMLLRFMETGKYRRLGEKEERSANVRFVVATNSNDFMYNPKLYVSGFIPRFRHIIKLPPVRYRASDIKLLAEFFLNKFKSDFTKYPLADKLMLNQEELNDWERSSWENSNVRGIQTAVGIYFFNQLTDMLNDEIISDKEIEYANAIPKKKPGPKKPRISDKEIVETLENNCDKPFHEIKFKANGKVYYKDYHSLHNRIMAFKDSEKKESTIKMLQKIKNNV
jgi:transcriptional regulator with AAA-type ATPase domain